MKFFQLIPVFFILIFLVLINQTHKVKKFISRKRKILFQLKFRSKEHLFCVNMLDEFMNVHQIRVLQLVLFELIIIIRVIVIELVKQVQMDKQIVENGIEFV